MQGFQIWTLKFLQNCKETQNAVTASLKDILTPTAGSIAMECIYFCAGHACALLDFSCSCRVSHTVHREMDPVDLHGYF
jgi:hypothetical protein